MGSGLRRLSGAKQFGRVFREGSRLNGRLCTIVVSPARDGTTRLGLSVSRRIGTAVARNRAKRLIREAFRSSSWGASGGLEVVVVAREGLLDGGLVGLAGELNERWRRWARRQGQDRARGTPSSHRG